MHADNKRNFNLITNKFEQKTFYESDAAAAAAISSPVHTRDYETEFGCCCCDQLTACKDLRYKGDARSARVSIKYQMTRRNGLQCLGLVSLVCVNGSHFWVGWMDVLRTFVPWQ